ncbi:MAG TPA: phosphoribosyl-ATP diphosphatase [Dongiaceae bacterium]|jgi:phosphoribosyl-ATP pyrophosphohydrolase|nr:phosphoribosyl-ATP diphosphatase [Dongiaceae bacterium]
MFEEETGKILDRMYAAMMTRRTADPKQSKAAKLLQRGRPKIARKLGENVFETTIAAIGKDAEAVVDESAKLLYMLLALWADCGVEPAEVWKKLQAREVFAGLAEQPQDEERE